MHADNGGSYELRTSLFNLIVYLSDNYTFYYLPVIHLNRKPNLKTLDETLLCFEMSWYNMKNDRDTYTQNKGRIDV